MVYYNIKPYLYYKTQDGHFMLQNKVNSLAVNNRHLIEFLTYLEKEDINKISENQIHEFFDNNNSFANKVTAFLENNDIIMADSKKEINFSMMKLLEYGNNNLLKTVEEHVEGATVINNINMIKDDDLLIVLINPFSLENLKSITDSLSSFNDLVYKIIFPYNNSIYISNYHSRKWNNPCPKCFFYALESQLRGSISGDLSFNFQTMVDLFYTHNVEYKYEGLLERSDFIPVTNILLRDSLKINMDSDIDDVYRINLSNYDVTKDTNYYWEMCDCYE